MKLSKKSIPYKLLSRTGTLLIIILFIGPTALASAGPLQAVLGILGFFALVGMLVGYEYLYWKKYEFYFEHGDLKITSGVLTRNNLDIPVRRIQNVDIERSWVQRIIGLAEVRIETAGGSSTEASLRYLELDDAEKIKSQVRQLKDRTKTEEGRDREEKVEEGEEQYALSDGNLLLLSLTSVNASTIGIAIFFLIFAGGGISSTGSFLGTLGAIISVIVGVTFLAAFYVIMNAATTFSQYYDFKVERRNDTIEYERGLFNKKGGSIPKEKIQTIIISDNFLKRFFGYATLKVETAGYNQGDQVSGSTVLIPLDTRENVLKYAEELGKFEVGEMHNITTEAKERYFRRYILVSLLVAVPVGAAVYLGVTPLIFAIPALVALGARAGAELKWENIGYSFEDNNLFVMNGFWNRKTYMVPYFRFQNIIESQSVFQRRWGMKSVTVDTAGSVWTNPTIIDMDEDVAEKVSGELLDRFRNSTHR